MKPHISKSKSSKAKLLLATTNQGKIKEYQELLKELPLEVISLKQITGQENFMIKETGVTFKDNAKIKAEVLGMKTGLLTLADDSGLEIDALGGAPGVKSQRFAKTDSERINKAIMLMKNIPEKERTARFKACLALYFPESGNIKFFQGVAEGKISKKPKGKSGFGYDPIFFSDELGKTFGQASSEEKNKVSHRGKALIKVKNFLLKYPPIRSKL